MTDIPNRHAFHISIEEYNAKIHEYKNIRMGLFDLNGLKAANDNFGHECGDIYICDAVKLMNEVFGESHIFRIGGDEFATIITDIEPSLLEEKHEKLNALVSEYNKSSKFEAGIAFGYAYCIYDEEDSLEKALKRADSNMYVAKKRMKYENLTK